MAWQLKAAIVAFFSALGLKIWPFAEPVFKGRQWLSFIFLFIIVFMLSAALFLTGCAAIPDVIDNTLGNANQKTSSGPLYKYRADLKITLPTNPNRIYSGTIANLLTGPIDIGIKSLINIDRAQLTTCARQDVCEKAGDCPNLPDGRKVLEIEDGWFGQAGKTATYHFYPSKKELEGFTCPLYIEVFSGNSLVSWGMIGFRTDEKLPAHVSCNGQDWSFSGVTVCQSKGGLDQQIWFDKDIADFEAEATCHAKQIDKRNFNIRPSNGFCRVTFFDGADWHRAIFIGYDQVLVRGGN